VTPLAETVAVTRRFDGFTAVDRVSARVNSGEVVGLLGANGAGKTTLIRLLLGLVRASAGEVRLFGSPPTRSTRRRVGYVPQGLGLYDDLTPVENLAFSTAVFGGASQTLPSAIGRFADVPVGELPLGVRRRVAFAQALGHGPDLLVLDEPTSGVDPLASARLWEAVRDAAERGAGVLVTTHQMEEAEECDRLVVMANGSVVAEGPPPEIVGNARVVVVDTDSWSEAFNRLARAGIRPALVGQTLRVPGASREKLEIALDGLSAHLHDAAATLEERFLELTNLPA
jgi:ABC-2 type transport system ATP-binding protein